MSLLYVTKNKKNPYLNILLHYLLFLLSNFTTAPLTPPDIATSADVRECNKNFKRRC